MKRVLSLFLAISLVFGAFAGIAGAAEQTTVEKYEELANAGIFNGVNDNGDAGLDQAMTRGQLAKVVALLLGLPDNAAAANGFKDIVSHHWAKPYIGAVVKAGIMEGLATTKFSPNANMTVEQVAKVVVLASGLEPKADAEVSGTVSDWAKGYVAAAVEAGLITPVSNYKAEASRSVLVSSAYTIYVELNTPEMAVNVSAVGAKLIEVKFNQAVDTTKATVEIKKLNNTVAQAKTTWSADNKVATIELGSKLTQGEYFVTVGGVLDPVVTKSITVENEKVTKIEFSEKAPLTTDLTNASVRVSFKILNQYGEDVTKAEQGSVVFTPSKGTITATDTGVITLTNSATYPYIVDEKFGISALYSTGLNSVYGYGLLTVSPRSAAISIDVVKLVNVIDAAKTPQVGDLAENYKLIIEAKNQYGTAVKAADLKNDAIVYASFPGVADVKTTSVGAMTYGDFRDEKINGETVTTLTLKSTDASGNFVMNGTSNVYIYLKNSSDSATYEVVVGDKSKVDSLTLSAPELAVLGETVTIPFTALDKNGNEITDAAKLNVTGPNGSLLSLTSSLGTLYFEKNYTTQKAELKLNLTGAPNNTFATPVYITGVTSTGKPVSLTFTAQPIKKAVNVVEVKDTKKILAFFESDVASTTIEHEDIMIEDQYGRKHKASDMGVAVRVTIDTNDTDLVSVSGTTVSSSTNVVTLTAKPKAGSASITLDMYDSVNAKYFGAYEFQERVVNRSSIVDYKIGDIGKLYTKPAGNLNDYAKAVAVTGLLSDGQEAAVPATDNFYTVTESAYGVDVISHNKLVADYTQADATGGVLAGDKTDATINVQVKVITNTQPKTLEKQVAVSSILPYVETIELKDGAGVSKKAADYVVVTGINGMSKETLAQEAIKVVDQYGVELKLANEKFVKVELSNFNGDIKYNGTAFTGANATDSVWVTVYTPNNKAITFKAEAK